MATTALGTPSLVTSARTRSPPAYTVMCSASRLATRGRTQLVDQGDDGNAAGAQRSLDDQIALGHEQALTIVVATLRATGQATLVQPEDGQPGVVGIVDRHELQNSQGNSLQSGSRLSRNAVRPSCASSDMYARRVASPANTC